MKKKPLILLLALLLLAALALPAQADNMRLTPPRRPVNPNGTPYVYLYSGSRAGSVGDVAVVQQPTLGGEGVFSVSLADGVSAQGVEYQFILADYESGASTLETRYKSAWSSENTFRYTFYEARAYYLLAYARRNGGSLGSATYYFTVNNIPGATSVQSRASEIVAECRAAVSGEYETALWLHDWITHHTYYDQTYSYYGADAILFHGTGVCDSYAKLYSLLLQTAGLQAVRVVGAAGGGNHAWNAVKIDGAWCQVDVTWDDPTGGDHEFEAVSGFECYDYFGLNDAFMQLDHDYDPPVACHSLANCHAYRAREHRTWMEHVWPEIEQNLADGLTSFDVDTKGRIMAGGGYYYGIEFAEDYVNRTSALAAALMSMDRWLLNGTTEVAVAFTYDSATRTLHAEVSALEDDRCGESVHWSFEGGVLTVSGEGGMYDYDYALRGADQPWRDLSVTAVVVEAGVTRIGAAAFCTDGSAPAATLTVADTVTAIGEHAFDGRTLEAVACACDSCARAWAEGRGVATQLTHLPVAVAGVEATCTEPGLTEGTACGRCGDVLLAQADIAPLGHDWLAPVYEWTPDYAAATAVRVCGRDQTHREEETAPTAFRLGLAPTWTEPGETLYTAVFESDAFGTQEACVADIPALSELAVLELPDDLDAIGDEAFMNLDCEAVLIPDGCRVVGARAFAGCEALIYIRIPSTVTDLAADALEGCGPVRIDSVGE